MKLYPDTKVYIACPGNIHTGGPELCHQLCSQLIRLGVDAYIFYLPPFQGKFNPADPVDDLYKKYHVPYVLEPEDKPQNILIAPEVHSEQLYLVRKMQRAFWWMSINNYLIGCLARVVRVFNSPLAAPAKKFFYFHAADGDIEHWCQSEYARQFVKLNGVAEDKIFMLEDYLREEFLSKAAQIDLSRKENIITFNPLKGSSVTANIIMHAPTLNWRPIENMTPAQVQELLASAKVYIDFGEHPGRDRIPREAAISGCVVITGKRGAAGNDIDINIPAEFKFDDAKPQSVIEKICAVFKNFPAAHAKQAAYRARILDDKNRFVREVEAVFGIKNYPLPSVTFIQGLNRKSFLLIEKLFQGGEFAPKFIIDDVMATVRISTELIVRRQNRNYLRVGENLVEIISRDDAKFLSREGRIEKFVLSEPTDAELAEVRNFYATDAVIF